jgi:hypothetical protein
MRDEVIEKFHFKDSPNFSIRTLDWVQLRSLKTGALKTKWQCEIVVKAYPTVKKVVLVPGC